MMIAFCRAGWIAAALLVGAGLAHASDESKAIATGGKGDLTMCPITFAAYRNCNLYHHIKLPPQMAVGDTVRVRFGSNTKHYNFPVARIVRNGGSCTVFSQLTETDNVEKIEIASCGEPAAAQ